MIKITKIKINKNMLKFELIYWIFITILMLFFNYISFEIEKNIRIVWFEVATIIAVVVNVLMIVLKNETIEFYKRFFIIALALGIIYCAIIPIGTANDEFSHILRTYEIVDKYTNFNFKNNSKFSKSFDVLENLKNDKFVNYSNYIEKFSEFNLNNEVKDFSEKYENTKLYSPLQYLPQVIGMSIANLFSDNIIILVIFSRLFGLLFWICICTYSIKIIPSRKTFFAILMLLPIHICTASCLSGDTVTNAMCMLFITILYKNLSENTKIDRKDKIIFIISGTMIALCKIVYLPFVFLVLLLTKENFDTKKENITFKTLVILISCIVGISWFLIGSLILSSSNTASIDQVKYILEDPLRYIFIMIQTYLNSGGNLIFQSTTGYELLCDSRVLVYQPVSYILSILIILGLFIKDEGEFANTNKLQKNFVWLVILGTIILITTAIYIQWTSMFEIGFPSVLGLQGRYFIPIYALLIFTINKFSIDLKKEQILNVNLIMQIIMFLLVSQAYIK